VYSNKPNALWNYLKKMYTKMVHVTCVSRNFCFAKKYFCCPAFGLQQAAGHKDAMLSKITSTAGCPLLQDRN
jgi:peroxiredoxin